MVLINNISGGVDKLPLDKLTFYGEKPQDDKIIESIRLCKYPGLQVSKVKIIVSELYEDFFEKYDHSIYCSNSQLNKINTNLVN
jgi:hypothetical protein